MSFQTSNSGAFRSLHCLIYKVLAQRLSVAEHSLSYHSFLRLSSTFSTFFKIFFRARLSWRPLQKLRYLITLLRTCQALFSTFPKFFQRFLCSPGLDQKAWLLYHNRFALSSPFFIFLRTFSSPSGTLCLCQTACIIYQILSALSTPFSKKFQVFFSITRRHFSPLVI